jgi:hypothetical protein
MITGDSGEVVELNRAREDITAYTMGQTQVRAKKETAGARASGDLLVCIYYAGCNSLDRSWQPHLMPTSSPGVAKQHSARVGFYSPCGSSERTIKIWPSWIGGLSSQNSSI